MNTSVQGSTNVVRIGILAMLGAVLVLGMVGAINAHGSANPQYSSLTISKISPSVGTNTLNYNFTASVSGGVYPSGGSACSSGSECSYSWNFGDGSPVVSGTSKSTTFTMSHSFTNAASSSSSDPDNYTVLLQVKDSSGVSVSQSVQVSVYNSNNGGGGGSSSGTSTGSNWWWLILVVVIAVALIVLLVAYRHHKDSQQPPEGVDQAGYGAAGAYSYDYANNPMYQAPMDGSAPTPADPSQLPPDAGQAQPPESPSPSMDAPMAETAAPAAEAAAAAPAAVDHTNCVVCGGPLAAGYCAQCNMDWNKGSSGSSA